MTTPFELPSTPSAPAPVAFISHGAPTFALEPGALGPQLQALGRQLQGLNAVLVVSPHWQTPSIKVMVTPQPQTVHDFGGFPAEMYRLDYPATGFVDAARATADRLSEAGWPVSLDERRGLDHGAWVPLWHLLGAGKVPVFQVSMPLSLTPAQAVELGRVLAPLRQQGIMILASGSMTHNLYEFRQFSSQPQPYVQEFAFWVRQALTQGAVEPLIDYRRLAPHAERAHPTEEHFLPLLVALGARLPSDAMAYMAGGITHGVISMDSFVWQTASDDAASGAST